MKSKLATGMLVVLMSASLAAAAGQKNEFHEYKLLATSKTSTMEKELNEAASVGFRFEATVGGESAFGGKEVVVIMARTKSTANSRMEYKLLATKKTSTMQKEMKEAGLGGFQYKGQTIFETAFGGKEVVVILERDRNAPRVKFDYRLLATNKTSTMEKELLESADLGYVLVGTTVAETAFGGKEVVSILHKQTGE
jgi:hypothetical protein